MKPDYFIFTKKERIAILTLVSLIILVYVIPYNYSLRKNSLNTLQKNNLLTLSKKPEADSSGKYKERHFSSLRSTENNKTYQLFFFDPNSTSFTDWEKLGVKKRTIETILNYLKKGGHFFRAEDLQKIYGLKKEDYERVFPYIRIPVIDHKDPPQSISKIHYKLPPSVDVNTADTTAFIALPLIGSKRSIRIVNFREKLGGFYSVDQIGDLYGLPDSVFQKIKPYLIISPVQLKQIDINSADANRLKQHPYISWPVANAIVQYRLQHGNFKSITELKSIVLIDTSLYKKLAPYLTAGRD